MEREAIEELLDTTAPGRKVVDIGRNLSEVQLRNPAGAVIEFASITFLDLSELERLSDRLECGSDAARKAFRAEGAPEFIVSATMYHRCSHERPS